MVKYFFFVLGHDIYRFNDFGNVIDLLTDLLILLYMGGSPLVLLLVHNLHF